MQSQDQKQPLTVVVTGAAGQIAYSFIGLLGNGEVFGKDQPINLRLLDIEPCQTALKGVEMEIQDCAYDLIVSLEIGFDPLIIFREADVAIFFGGFPRQPGMQRADLLEKNRQIFVVQGQALDKVAKKTCKSIVIANPANTNALILLNNAPSIPKENFTCLTRLDHNRALSQLSLRSGKKVRQVQNVIIWGNHSDSQYPDFHHATIDGKSAQEVINDQDWLKGEFITKVQKRGAAIIEARKLSSAVSAANATKDHLRDWLFGTPKDQFVSMGVYSAKNPYGIDENLVYSFPVKCKNFTWEYESGLSQNEFSQNKLKATEQELQDERSKII